jgi:hypothetical protein
METGPKIRPFSRIFPAGESPSPVKMSPRCGWRTHFSPNLSTTRIGMVRDFPEKKGLMEVEVWISLAQPRRLALHNMESIGNPTTGRSRACRMRPMVENAGAAFRHHPRTTDRTGSVRAGQASLRVQSTRANCIGLSPADRPHFHSKVFFQLSGNFGRELAHFLTASNLRPNKTSLCRILTEMARPKVSQRLSTAEYLFSVSSQPLLKRREIRGPRSLLGA